MKENGIENLMKCPLFKGVSVEEIVELIENVEYKINSYKKGEFVVHENDECNTLRIILEGSVRAEMTDYTGKVIKIEDIGAYRPLAPAFLFGMKNKYPVSIITNETSQIFSVSKESTLSLFMQNKHFLLNYLNLISNRAQFLSQKIKFLSFQTIKGKIAHYLLNIQHKAPGDNILMPVSHTELSEMFGVARPSISRAIREMVMEGYIEAEGKLVKIPDRNKLANLMR